MTESLTYLDAGVDIDKANSLVSVIKRIAGGTSRSGVMGEIGGFGGLFSLNIANIERPVLVSATDGVEVGTEKVWEICKDLDMPRAVFINKMERERADFFSALDDVRGSLSEKVIPVHLPIGKEDQFKGVIDLLEMKAFFFKGDGSGESEPGDIPADLSDQVEEYREALVEAIAESDDALIEMYELVFEEMVDQ